MTPRFDPSRALICDLMRGQLKDDEGNLRVNLPISLLTRLFEGAGDEVTQDFAAALGADLGRRVQGALGAQSGTLALESWVEHLGGQLALLGFGELSAERWGKALVLRVKGVPAELQGLVGVVLEGALQRALGRDIRLPGFAQEDGASYLVLSPSSAERVHGWASSGVGFAGTLERLHGGAEARS